MMRIFISYSSKDRDLLTSLVSDLHTLGHECWYDAELTRTGGQKWWSNILENVHQCDLFIFALTPSSLASEPCKREYGYARDLHKRILPVMLETVDAARLPVALAEIQFVDYRERSSKQGIALASTLNNLPLAQPMPNLLPPEPETPLSPLTRLGQRVDAPALTGTEQVEITFELEALVNHPDTRIGAEALMRTLYSREDLTNRVGEKIRALLPDMDGGMQPPTVIKGSSKPNQKRVTGSKISQATHAERQRGPWLWAYLVLLILENLICIDSALNYLDRTVFYYALVAISIFSIILCLVACYLTLLWKKRGVNLLVVDATLIAVTVLVIGFRMATFGIYINGVSKFSLEISWVVTVIMALAAVCLRWLVLRNKWASFE